MKKIIVVLLSMQIASCNLSVEKETVINLDKSEEIANTFYTILKSKDYSNMKEIADTSFFNTSGINKLKIRDSLFGDITKYEIMKAQSKSELTEEWSEMECVVYVNVKFEKKSKYYKEKLVIREFDGGLKITSYYSKEAS